MVKIDAEGSEVDILTSINKKYFKYTDFVLEINSRSNAKKNFKLSKNYKFNIFSQKVSWNLIKSEKELSSHHTEGSIFISHDEKINWY